MNIIVRDHLNLDDKSRILRLWNQEYPERLTYNSFDDFDQYLNKLKNLNNYLLLDKQNKLKGWASTFDRDNEKWFAIIISSELHGQGIGTKLLDLLKYDESNLNGWVIDHNLDKKLDGNTYRSPLEFYVKNDFEILKDIRLDIDIMSAVKINWKKTYLK